MKYCQHCGVQLEDSARFCPHCGTPVPDPAARKPAAPGQDQTAAADNRRQPEVPRPVHKRRGIAAQFDAIAAGQKPQGSYLTYWYVFSDCCITRVLDCLPAPTYLRTTQ